MNSSTTLAMCCEDPSGGVILAGVVTSTQA